MADVRLKYKMHLYYYISHLAIDSSIYRCVYGYKTNFSIWQKQKLAFWLYCGMPIKNNFIWSLKDMT